MKKKVLFIIWSYSSGGGAERILANIVNHLDLTKYSVEILEYYHSNKSPYTNPAVKILNPIVDETNTNVINLIKLKIIHCVLIKLCPGLIRKLHLNKTYDIEVSFNEQIPIFLLNKKSKKLISWIHGPITHLENEPYYRIKQSQKLKYVNNIVAISNDTKESIEKIYPQNKNKLIKIHNGYDFSNHTQIYKIENFDLLYCNRFDDNKNPLQFIKIVSTLKKLGYNLKCKMLGDGALLNETKKLISSENLNNEIECLGYTNNPYPYFKSCKLFCLTSQSEGFPTTVVEALYYGKPFISFDVGGIGELSENGKNGFVVESQDSYVNAVITLLTDICLYQKMSESAAKYVLNYDINKQIKNIEKLL